MQKRELLHTMPDDVQETMEVAWLRKLAECFAVDYQVEMVLPRWQLPRALEPS